MNMDFTMCLEIYGPDFELFSGNYRTRRDIDKKSFFWCKIGQTKTNDALGKRLDDGKVLTTSTMLYVVNENCRS
jgi:hypothetical protein